MNTYEIEYRFVVSPSPDPREKIGRVKGVLTLIAANPKEAEKEVRKRINAQWAILDEKSKAYLDFQKELTANRGKERLNYVKILFSKAMPKPETKDKDGCC